MRLWPRSIRWQMLAGLLLLEVLSIGFFAAVLTRQQIVRANRANRERLSYEASSLAMQTSEAISESRPEWAGKLIRMMDSSPTVTIAKVTDAAGTVLYVSKGDPRSAVLEDVERAQMPLVKGESPRVFSLSGNRLECVRAIHAGAAIWGYAWVENDQTGPREQLASILEDTLIFGLIWVAASAIMMMLFARSIARPLAVLHRGTSALMNSPESGGNFPLPVPVRNEFGDLIEAFNRMFASIEEQRSGLNDTLSMLDSMLANAPIGLAFFDRRCRFVRVNHVFADLTGIPLSRHLGRTLPELLPQPVAQEFETAVSGVFASQEPLRNLEVKGFSDQTKRPWAWLVSAYPVRTAPNQIRWAGVIVLDTSERRRNEEALRRTEKLAAAGRLAASIAHEINNPLEAITNLLFLLRNYASLDESAMNYVDLAQNEARRIAEITQQTLRFYRQSTSPTRTNLKDLLDSVLSLYQIRLHNLGIKVEREYNPETDLYCFAGEIRQVIANMVGNAIDATSGGGRLIVRARRSHNWKGQSQEGVRFTIADTGTGFDHDVRERIFEAFFTTKEATGTGLGLWVSHEIILKHRGLVHVRSRTDSGEKPSGTVFQLFFPDNQNLAAPVRHPVTVRPDAVPRATA